MGQTRWTYMDFPGGGLYATHSFLEVFRDILITVCNYPSQGSGNLLRRHEKQRSLGLLQRITGFGEAALEILACSGPLLQESECQIRILPSFATLPGSDT